MYEEARPPCWDLQCARFSAHAHPSVFCVNSIYGRVALGNFRKKRARPKTALQTTLVSNMAAPPPLAILKSVVLRRAAGTADTFPSVIMQSENDPWLRRLVHTRFNIQHHLLLWLLKGLKPSSDLRSVICGGKHTGSHPCRRAAPELLGQRWRTNRFGDRSTF